MTFNQHYRELGLQCRHSDGIPVQLGDEVHSMGSGTKRLLVAEGPLTAFFSYCREDSDFALRLAGDLKAAGASVWLDQLDIIPGQRWDRAVEDALAICPRMLVILSPISVDSTNVMDEVSFALEEKKTVIPVIYRDCAIPFRLRRVQYVDFRQDYARGLKELLKTLVPEQRIGQSKSAISDVPGQLLTDVAEPDSHECAAEGEPRKTVQDSKVAEQARVDQEPQQAAKREGFDQELKRTEQRHLPNKAQNATVRARLEEDRKPAAEQTQKDQEHEQAAASSPASKLLLGLATLGVALSLGVLGTVPINYFGFLPVGVALVVLVALVSWRMVWRKQITWPRMLAASLFMALAMIAVETLFSGLFRVGGYYFHTYIVHLLFTSACIGMLQAVFCASLTRKDVFVPASRLLLGLATIGIALVVETALAVLTVFSTRVEGFSIVRTLRVPNLLILVIGVPILCWWLVWRKHITGRRMLTAGIVFALLKIVLDILGGGTFPLARTPYILFASAISALLMAILCAKLESHSEVQPVP